ncbi:MAG: DNA recombination protein RmuC [Xanthomonadales bacterium]|nr:DNA recombination protein RmuC [Xanthomonadales bacterium]
MPAIDITSLLIGLLLALVIFSPLVWLLCDQAARRAAGKAAELAARDAAEEARAEADALAERRLAPVEGRLALASHELEHRRQELAQANTQLERARADIERLRQSGEKLLGERQALLVRSERIPGLESELHRTREENAGLARELAQIRTRAQEQQRAAADRMRDLESAREQLKVEFQALASEILEDKSRRFSQANQEQLGHLLNPLREQLGDFRRAVSEAYEKEGGARVELRTELRQLMALNQQLAGEASSLTRALTADSRSQGYWGELKLERLLELAGLEKGREYLTQESFRDGDGDRYRPDAVLKLPGGRDIIIDAKVNLTDYQRACASEEGQEREQHLGRHVAAMRRHLQQLGDKDYSRLEGLDSPDLVFMFVPVEGAFLEGLRRDGSLYDEAFRRRIVAVGPSNLLASLRLVAQIWRTEEQNRNARLIAERAGALYDKFVGFIDDMGKLGDALDRAQRLHQAALGKLAQGRGNLVRRAEQLKGLGVSPGKQLPAALLGLSDSAADHAPDDDNDDADKAGADEQED